MLLYTPLSHEDEQILHYKLQRALPWDFLWKLEILSHRDITYKTGQGVAYDRHFLVQHAKAEYVYMIDHDNEFDEMLFENTIMRYDRLSGHFGSDLVLSPTICQDDDAHIQSQGITGFSYLFPKYTYRAIPADQDRQTVHMIGANSLFGPRRLFQKFQFDPVLEWSYEDIDFTRRLTRAGYPLVVVKNLKTIHKEWPRSFLQTRFLSTPRSAYLRGRNRCIFIKKTATTRQKVQYFAIWVWIQTIGFSRRISRYGGKTRKEIIKSLRQGTVDGIRYRVA